MKRWTHGVCLVAAMVLVAPGMSLAGASAQAQDTPPGSEAVESITADDLLPHLEALQEAADAHGGNRALDTPGYDASVDYVVDRIDEAGLTPQLVPFTVEDAPIVLDPPEFERIAPTQQTYVEGVDFVLPAPGAPVDSEGAIHVIEDGCDGDEWDGLASDSVVLVALSSHCLPAEYLGNAWNNVAGLLLAPEEGAGEPPAHVHLDQLPVFYELPTMSVSGDVAAELTALAETDTVTVRLDPGYGLGSIESVNVMTEIPGRTDEVVIVGGHLDSVPDGPGINDNGSGAAGVLALAEHLAEASLTPDRTIRFAWWGAEESPILGSTAYVDSLSQSDLDEIVAYLNVDMIGSPNWVRRVVDPGVADGDDSVSEGSEEITELLEAYFDDRDLPTEPVWWGHLSDTYPFGAAGVPVGGLNTGAIEIKTEREAELYGGTAGEPLDPCYHQPCDTLANVDVDIAAEMTRALGYVTLQLTDLPDDPEPPRVVPLPEPAPVPVRTEPTFTG